MYLAHYQETSVVLAFDTEDERNDYVSGEEIVHPECVRATFDEVAELIKGKTPIFDEGFGCMVFK